MDTLPLLAGVPLLAGERVLYVGGPRRRWRRPPGVALVAYAVVSVLACAMAFGLLRVGVLGYPFHFVKIGPLFLEAHGIRVFRWPFLKTKRVAGPIFFVAGLDLVELVRVLFFLARRYVVTDRRVLVLSRLGHVIAQMPRHPLHSVVARGHDLAIQGEGGARLVFEDLPSVGEVEQLLATP